MKKNVKKWQKNDFLETQENPRLFKESSRFYYPLFVKANPISQTQERL